MASRGTGGLGGPPDRKQGLEGVAPKVLDAFLSAQGRQPSASDELAQGLFTEKAPTPVQVEAPGQFKSRPSQELLDASRARIRALVAAAHQAGPRSSPQGPLMPEASPAEAKAQPNPGLGPSSSPPSAPQANSTPPSPPTQPATPSAPAPPAATKPPFRGTATLPGWGPNGPTSRPSSASATPGTAPASPGAQGGASSSDGGSGVAGPLVPHAQGSAPSAAAGGVQQDLKSQFLAMRQGAQGPGVPTEGKPPERRVSQGPLPAEEAMKLAHLALRHHAQHKADPESAEASASKVEAIVAQRMGAEGAKALRESFAAIQDQALPGKLQELSTRVNQLVPGVDITGLSKDVGVRMVTNSLNPVLAISVAVAESAHRVEKLSQWDKLSQKERLAHVAHLTGNLAEILGALTPPPLNLGVQALGAGMTLVGLASENLEVDEVSKALGKNEALKRTANQASALGGRVQEAWQDLADRMEASKAKKPKIPSPLQSLFGSQTWGKLKSWDITAPLVEGTENVAHNLSRRVEGQMANVEASIQDLKSKMVGPEKGKAPPPKKALVKKGKTGPLDESAAPSEIDQAAEQLQKESGA